jgi:3-oxoacyl-[acyl-carrier-protein] synthase-3
MSRKHPLLGIADIGIYIPPDRLDNVSRATEFDKDPGFVRDKIGFTGLARSDEAQSTADLCVLAYHDLLNKNASLADIKIDCLIVVTQTPDGLGIPHTSAVLQSQLGLDTDVACFDISLGCSGYVYALSTICSFMQLNGFKNGLLFTADPYSKIMAADDPDTQLIFADAATVTHISDQPRYTLGKSLFATDGSSGHAIRRSPKDSYLQMNGRAVFMFTMKVVPEQIMNCLEKNKLDVEDIDMFLLHQGSRYIVENMRKVLGLPAEKSPFCAAAYGNTVSSSIPIMLENILLKNYNTILISGFGVGLSWATGVLTKQQLVNNAEN